ncbi:tetratricopeptide repeat protein [Vreelandella sp. GE22]
MINRFHRTLCYLTAAVALTAAMPAYSLGEDTQAAKDEGMRLYGIHHSKSAIPLLEQAAEVGDVEAMYYLGEANRRLAMGGLSNAAMDWYYQAAQRGEPYAMLRLDSGGACKLGGICPEDGNDWRDAALDATLPKAEDGDSAAMMALYSIYAVEDMEAANHWLLEAAEADNVYAQDWLGRRIRDGESGTRYTNDTERLEAAEVWFRHGAEMGYGPAIRNLAFTLKQLGSLDEAYEWLIKASQAGDIQGRLRLSWCYLDPGHNDICRNADNKAAGVGMLEAMIEEAGKSEAQDLLDMSEISLTAAQRAEADDIRNQWLNHEPPLSYFPAKFGF